MKRYSKTYFILIKLEIKQKDDIVKNNENKSKWILAEQEIINFVTKEQYPGGLSLCRRTYYGHSLSLSWRHRLLVTQTRSANCPITPVWMSHLALRGEHPHSYFLYGWKLAKLRRQYLCKLSLYSFVLHSMNYVSLWRVFTKEVSYTFE